MGSESEPAKALLPFLQRADELQKHEPLVAYYCRLYAMERGLKIPPKDRTKTTSALLVSLIKQLEKDKKSVTLGPEDNLYVEGFALNVFSKADKQDRAGKADVNTAKTFYAASIFFEILHQFGEIQPEIEQKQKYAVWKAADIRKAIKEGRKPEPGPPGSTDEFSASHDLSQGDIPQYSNSKDPDSIPAEEIRKEPFFQFSRAQQYESNNAQSHPGISAPDYQGRQAPASNSQHTQSFSNFSAADYLGRQAPASNLQHTQGFSNFTQGTSDVQSGQGYPDPLQVNPTSHSTSYYNLTASDVSHGIQPERTYPSNLPSQTYNATQSCGPDSQSYSTLHDGNAEPPTVNYASYPSDASYYEHTNGIQPAVIPSHTISPNSSYQSNSGYNSASNRDRPYGENQHRDHQSAAPVAPEAGNYNYNSGYQPPPAPVAPEAGTYNYDSSYQPPPDKISEAHKAARFAVGSLAFDDVPAAVDYLKRALDLLTRPSTS